jgi:hypothetical protein
MAEDREEACIRDCSTRYHAAFALKVLKEIYSERGFLRTGPLLRTLRSPTFVLGSITTRFELHVAYLTS